MRRDMRLFLVAMTSFHCADSKTIGNRNTLRGLCNVFASGSGFVRDFVLEKVAPRFRSVSFFVLCFCCFFLWCFCIDSFFREPDDIR